MMLDEAAADAVICWQQLRAEDFYRPEHGALYRVIEGLRQQGQPCDEVAVTEATIQNMGAVGGAVYVAELPSQVVSTSNVLHYARMVVDTARARQLFDAAADLSRGVLERRDPRELADEMQRRLEAVRLVRAGERAPVDIGEATQRAQSERHVRAKLCVPMGFAELDRMCSGGLKGGELVVVAARSSWGKSGFAVSVMLHAAMEGYHCTFISLEMTEQQVADRAIARLGEVPVDVVEAGGMGPEDEDRIGRGIEAAAELPLCIQEATQGMTVAGIATLARRMKRERGTSLLVVDYLEKIDHVREKGQLESKVIGNTTAALKRLALELQIPVVVLAQLNREAVKNVPRQRKDVDWWLNVPLPQLHHLKESGSIEQDADKVIFPVPADPIRSQQLVPELDAPPGAAVLILAKNRQGATGTTKARWHGPTTSYRQAVPALRVVAGGGARHYSETEREDEP